jgi:multidrug efflux pump subunit AcrA (membrane-fusion protein)
MTADVDIITTNIPNALTVPSSAIVTTSGKKYVWIVRDTALHKIPITTGPNNDTITVVKSGVAAGDRIAITPLATFTDGASVTVATPSPQPS